MKLKQINPKTWKVSKSETTDIEWILNSWGFPTEVELNCGNTIVFHYNSQDVQDILEKGSCDFKGYIQCKNYREDTIHDLLSKFYNKSKRILLDTYNEYAIESALEGLPNKIRSVKILPRIMGQNYRKMLIVSEQDFITFHLELDLKGQVLNTTDYFVSKVSTVTKSKTKQSIYELNALNSKAATMLENIEEALSKITILGAFKEDIDDRAV